ncbi:response regulator transcription factor [Thiorhodovibrio frisius]|uniref:Response regulator with CheY-like receiver domain and winged-helix DNA-binding domain n=1 Tax=Thiorhodovibrio frisius TaxID=631362 RepID=H8Z2U4_9GAMM|nr:response regulator transcription factor [Thiorhodovibrio frisius]EIC21680.1 response regulator with CheY-like receiver domain and winged-helix DNA-binding domain [Thiorhodovibrio frisius]WPL21648.1 Transcriptional regulatory protein CusR [Thiorhodovibrio frisius]
MRVLLVEDDVQLGAYLKKALAEIGALVDVAEDGREGLLMAASSEYDLLLLDRLLPQVDGLTILRTLRASGDRTPVLILSALGDVDDRVEGLRAGGDDYLVKPPVFSELQARIEALMRRTSPAEAASTRLRLGDLEMDLLAREVTRAGERIALQPREFRLLEYLLRHAGQVVTRTMLLEHVWDYHFDPQTNVIDVHVSRLRGKIDKGFAYSLLHTVRGAGYVMRAPDAPESGS